MPAARLRSVVSSALVGAGFVPVWLATAALLVIALAIAPDTLKSDSLSSAVLPFTSFLAIAALGQMLVIMTGGIDLSVPGTIAIVAHLVVGVSGSSNGKLATAILACVGWAALIGLVNGVLVSVLRLNALIVTLAVGQIVLGITIQYSSGIANESAVPSSLSTWATNEWLGVSWLFWMGVFITIVLALVLRGTSVGRRFQAVGANPRTAWIMGIHVRSYVASAYVAASVLYATAGILLAALIRSPTLDLGDPYLLGPIAAVVIGGASLAGGLASVTSTWAAAFGLTLLSQMLRVLGLSTALQFVVFGVAIMAGMVISGDRIVGALGGVLQRPAVRRRLGAGEAEEGRELKGLAIDLPIDGQGG